MVACARGPYRGGLRLAVVVSGWPRISETFTINELTALRRAGILEAVYATKPGDRTVTQPGIDELDDLVTVLEPGEVAAQAGRIADDLADRRVDGIHGYFAHQPAEVAAVAAGLLGVPYGFSVHALDVRKVAPTELARRCAGARVVVCCNDDVAASIAEVGHQPVLVRHGVDLERFDTGRTPRDGPVQVLAVGRLMAKKGFDVLVEALTDVPRAVAVTIVGEGPERGHLTEAIARAGLEDIVRLVGSRTHDELAARYADSDIVVVPSVIDRDGDRDGLPNVVLEAMACGRAVIASRVAAIPSAIDDGLSGVLIPPGDPTSLAAALVGLIDRPDERRRLGKAARVEAELRFSLGTCTGELIDVLQSHYGAAHGARPIDAEGGGDGG